eukprot:jgi/Picre1/31036/NNA_006393.t1
MRLSRRFLGQQNYPRLLLTSPPSPRTTGVVVHSKREKEFDLVQRILEQTRRDSLPWVQDLVLPILPDFLNGSDARLVPSDPVVPSESLVEDGGDCRFETVYGVKIHYRDVIPDNWDPSLPVIVKMHGYNASLFSWRGTIDGTARLARAFLERVGVETCVLVGHSAGALTALFLSEIDPTLVDGLVFVAPALPSRKEYSFQNRATFGTQLRIVLSRAIMSMDEPGLRFVRRMIAKQKNSILENGLGYRPHPATSARYGELDESNLSEEMLLQEAIDGYFLPLKTANWDMGALLNLRSFTIPMQYDYSKVQQPILVALGETDPLTPSGKCLVEILEERSGCVTESIEFDKCGHIPMEECPIEFNKALIDFYQSQFRV